MVEVVSLIILTVVMLGVFIFLYSQGYMVSKSISAVVFIGSTKGNSAKFSSCSGYMKRVIKFKEDGTYTFVLDAELSKGDMSVELIDSTKQKNYATELFQSKCFHYCGEKEKILFGYQFQVCNW